MVFDLRFWYTNGVCRLRWTAGEARPRRNELAKNLATAYHNLSTMLDAGVSLLRSLETVASGLRGAQKQAFLRLRDTLAKGSSLAEAMEQNPRVFRPLDVMIIDSAETSGNLGESFGLLGQWYEFSHRMSKMLRSGMVLPIFVITFAAFLVPVPKFVFSGWDAGVYISGALTILMIFYIPAGIIYSIVRFTPQKGLPRRIVDQAALSVPVLGGALYRLAISRYCRVFHMMSQAGVPITQCVEKATLATGNAAVARMFEPMAESVRQGQPASTGLSGRLPAELRGIWEVGEESGTLDATTGKLAENYAYAAEFRFQEFVRWLPRIVYALIAMVLIYYIFQGWQMIYGQFGV